MAGRATSSPGPLLSTVSRPLTSWALNTAQAARVESERVRGVQSHDDTSSARRPAAQVPPRTLRLLRGGASPAEPTGPAADRLPHPTAQPHGSDRTASSTVAAASPCCHDCVDDSYNGFVEKLALRRPAADGTVDVADELMLDSPAASMATDGCARSPMPPSVNAALEVSADPV